jgi:hypothetical protein
MSRIDICDIRDAGQEAGRLCQQEAFSLTFPCNMSIIALADGVTADRIF